MAHNMAPVEDMPMCSHLTNDTEVSLERNNESSMSKELDCRSVRRVYLITYSRADLVKFPTRRSFAHAVLALFSGVPASIQQWCCSQEEHQSSTGKHYHMAIKFDKNQRWLSSKRYLLKNNGISVHFSAVHNDYYSAWKYAAKEDKDALESDDHPDLTNTTKSPRTTEASKKRSSRAKARAVNYTLDVLESECGDEGEDDGERRKKRKRITAFEISEIIVEKGIRSREELLIFAKDQKDEGKKDIAEFIVNRGSKVVADVINTTWEMECAKQKKARREKSRMQLLHEAREDNCVEGCNGLWLQLAKEVLENNGIILKSFQQAVINLLTKGRGKYRNIMIIGPANCGKTFILNPITKIFTTFSNPASSSFAWVDAEKAECLFLNDFRWSQAIIPWHDLLLLLEGQLVHLPAPKTHFAKDICFACDTPIFAAGKNPICFVKNGSIDDRETEMMAVRWKIFRFNCQILEAQQKEVESCPKCFANLILSQ